MLTNDQLVVKKIEAIWWPGKIVRPGWVKMRQQMGRGRGWPPPQVSDFERESEQGALYVGSPDTVAKKFAETLKTLRVDRSI